jgi:uncharacterized LabA/DUF88 family protein
MDIELAVDAMELAEHIDQMVLFSGDGDFRSLVEAVQRRGVRVTVISTISGSSWNRVGRFESLKGHRARYFRDILHFGRV